MGEMEEEGELNELTHEPASWGKHATGRTRCLMTPHVIAFCAARRFYSRLVI